MEEKLPEKDAVKLEIEEQQAELEILKRERRTIAAEMEQERLELAKEMEKMKQQCAQLQMEKEKLQDEIKTLLAERKVLKVAADVGQVMKRTRKSTTEKSAENSAVNGAGCGQVNLWQPSPSKLRSQKRQQRTSRSLVSNQVKNGTKISGKDWRKNLPKVSDIKVEDTEQKIESVENSTDRCTCNSIQVDWGVDPPRGELHGADRRTKADSEASDSGGDSGPVPFLAAGEDEDFEDLQVSFDCSAAFQAPDCAPLPSQAVKAEEDSSNKKELDLGDGAEDGPPCQSNTREPETESSQFNQLNAKTSFVCKECAQSFSMKSQYLQHLKLHLGSKTHQCPLCPGKFTRLNHLRLHMRKHDATRKLHTCSHCALTFPSNTTLRKHVHVSHNKKIKADQKLKAKETNCKLCGETFSRASELAVHMGVHTDGKPFRCSECPASFTTRGNLTVHVKKHRGEKPFRCKECDATFPRSADLKSHVRRHSTLKPHVCSLCPAAFCRAGDLKPHMRTHTGEKPFQCEVCGAAFSTSSNLAVHRRIHTRERPFQCEKCGDSFSQLGHLTRHRSKHTTENSFKCPSCPKMFGNAYHLKVHMQRHNTDNTFKCKDCGAAFSRASILTEHVRIHTGDKPFKCDECPAAFARQTNLKAHLRKHTGERPYVCPHCKQGFTQSTSLNRHLQSKKACLARQGGSGSEAAGVKDTATEKEQDMVVRAVEGEGALTAEKRDGLQRKSGDSTGPCLRAETETKEQDPSANVDHSLSASVSAPTDVPEFVPAKHHTSVSVGIRSERSSGDRSGARTASSAGQSYGFEGSSKCGAYPLTAVSSLPEMPVFSESAVSASTSLHQQGGSCVSEAAVASASYRLAGLSCEVSTQSMLLPTITMGTEFQADMRGVSYSSGVLRNIADPGSYIHGNSSTPASSQVPHTQRQLHHP